MPHWSLCPMLFPTLLWFYFLLKKNDKKDQKIEKGEGECQFFCLHRLFMLVLWILVRRIEARKSRCCLKSYLKGGWSEEMTQCQGKPVIVVFHDLVQSDIQQLDSCISFQVLMVYCMSVFSSAFDLGVLVLDTWICWLCKLQLTICHRFGFVFFNTAYHSDPHLY